jgi:tetratricopeptide (TPR) repeat protein
MKSKLTVIGAGFGLMRKLASSAPVILVSWALLVAAGRCSAEPFIPESEAQVLEHLRAPGLDLESRQIHDLRRQLNADPTNLALAGRYVRKSIERARRESEPRYLGRAQAALAPWWSEPDAPGEALVLRASLKQSQHEFSGALSDLQLALKKDARNAQAWLTCSTVLAVLGDYPAARRACLPLAQLTPGLIALTAAANVASLSGEAERACVLLRNALTAHPEAPISEQVWALTVLAETATRLGHEQEAECCFKKALGLDPHDAYVRCAYVDVLLDQGREAETERLLKDIVPSDAALLRLILSESGRKPHPASLQEHTRALRLRFEEGHLRGDFVHQREEAQFLLHALGKPAEALRVARLNWHVQREPADARILLEAALAAGDKTPAQPVIEFVRNSRLEDVRLARLVEQVQHLSSHEE